MKNHDFKCELVSDRDPTGHFLGYECKYECKDCGALVEIFHGGRSVLPSDYYPKKEMLKVGIKEDCNLEIANKIMNQ